MELTIGSVHCPKFGTEENEVHVKKENKKKILII